MTDSAPPLINTRVLGAALPFAEAITSSQITKHSLQKVGITEAVVADPPIFVPYRIQAALAEEIARATGERHIAAIVTKSMPYETLGVYSDFVLSGQNLKQALFRGIRTLRFVFSASQISLTADQKYAKLQFDSKIQGTLGYRQLHEALPLTIISLVRRFAGEDWAAAWIELDHPHGTRTTELEDIYDAEVRCGAPFPAIVFDARLLRKTNPLTWRLANPPVLRDLRDMVRKYAPSRFSAVVRNTIELQLRAGDDASIEAVAQQLSIGVRTLQRRLMSESESFRNCLVSVQEVRAKALLKESDLTVSQIAAILGFVEPNSFSRAFHRWTNVSPSDYRRLFNGRT